MLFTDRGNGFYDSGSGAITDDYSESLKQHQLKAFFGADASQQPGELQELMLHETAVAWVRHRLTKTRPKQAWTETLGEYRARLKNCAAYINDNYDVEGLCRGLPKRLRTLDERRGDRIDK